MPETLDQPLSKHAALVMHPDQRFQALLVRLARAPLALFGPFAGLILLCGAAPSPVDAAFGQTIVSTYPDGRTSELYLQSDGTYTARGRRGDPSSGHWKVGDNKLCLTQSSPLAVPFDYCTPIPSGGLHTAWSAKAVTGEAIRVKLVKGHFVGKARAASNAEKPETESSRN